MSFTIDNKLSFIDRFQFLSSSLDSLVKNIKKNDFKYLSQEFDNNALDLVKQKLFYPDEYMSDFEKFKEFPSKENEYEYFLNVWKKFEMKTMKDYLNLYLKCDV